MEKQPIALKTNRAALSSADYNKSLQNIQQPYNFGDVIDNVLKKIEAERQLRLQAIREAYNWEIKKADNLKIAYAILADRKNEIQLSPSFDQQAFLEVVSETLTPVALWLLAYKVNDMSDSLNAELFKITKSNNPDLFYQYYEYDKEYENLTFNHKYDPEVSYGAYVPTLELLAMEDESKILLHLSCELSNLIDFDPNREELEILKEALKA